MAPAISKMQSTPLKTKLESGLAFAANQNLYRSRRVTEGPQAVNVVVDGKPYVNFCSNDYLGLANHPDVCRVFKNAVDQYGLGSGSAHLICGHSRAHHALEEELAAFTGRERALLFSSGYMANLACISTLAGNSDTVFEDRLNHASLIDGGLLSGANFKRYRHGDVGHLEALLMKATDHLKLIVTDGVFSMDGDTAPLQQLAELAQTWQAVLVVDDAHGFGVIGTQGRGLVNDQNLSQDEVPVLVGTLGKSFGSFGAFVSGSNELIETLIQQARTYIYTTAIPSAIAEATRVSLKLLMQDDWRRDKLHALVNQFRAGAEQIGLNLLPSLSPIQPVLIGDNLKTLLAGRALMAQGFLVGAIRPPTVPKGSARLRITFSVNHEPNQVDRLLDALKLALHESAKS